MPAWVLALAKLHMFHAFVEFSFLMLGSAY
jgi:hypothetical protein